MGGRRGVLSAGMPPITRAAALAVVESLMSGELADEEAESLPAQLDMAFGCPRGHAAGLAYWPERSVPTAAEVVDRARAYRPIAL